MSRNETKTYELTVKGLVQGIGYRPFVASMLKRLGLYGNVRNTGGIVKICVTAADKAVEDLIHRLYKYYPDGAKIIDISYEVIENKAFDDVKIIESDMEKSIPLLPADICICEKCSSELRDNNNRRYRYPFISCAACGPRYTIMKRIPYDRVNSTMQEFEMCDKCKKEYLEYGNRRHYAQTISCPDCGPQLYLDRTANSSDKVCEKEKLYGEAAFYRAVELLRSEQVVAVKNIGGYHLVCDAFSKKAVKKLRELKKRDKKPFAVMFKNTDAVKAYAYVDSIEEELLNDGKRPVVLLKKLNIATNPLVYEVGMESSFIGAMLPFGGLQLMLSDEFPVLVMTSANISGEPMIISDEEMSAFGVAVLGNNREILTPADDSIVKVVSGKVQIIRRGRGFVPIPLEINDDFGREIYFAAGADLKSAPAFGSGNKIYLSQYLGDLSHKRVRQEYINTKERFKACFNLNESVVVCDRHPLYYSGVEAKEAAQGKKLVSVSHHFAHVAAVMAEHGLDERLIAFSFDGTGFGEDGTVWGGEVFLYDKQKYVRAGHLKSVSISGGDEGARNAKLALASYLFEIKRQMGNEELRKEFGEELYKRFFDNSEYGLVYAALANGINTVKQSSAGRLFDAVAALSGVCEYNGYEGQCPSELQYAAENYPGNTDEEEIVSLLSPQYVGDSFVLDTPALIKQLLKFKMSGMDNGRLAYYFHKALAQYIVDASKKLREENATDKIILSGGVFVNSLFTKLCLEELNKEGFRAYISEKLPAGDDGLAAGQLYMALKNIKYDGEKICV